MNKIDGKEVIVNVSKSGRNLNARIPENFHYLISRGDKVKITLIEKKPSLDKENIDEIVSKYISSALVRNSNNKDRLSGIIQGIEINVSVKKIIQELGLESATKLIKLMLETRRID